MRGLQRRLAAVAVFSTVLHVTPIEGFNWLRGSNPAPEPDQDESQLRRSSAVFPFPTRAPTEMPSAAPSDEPSDPPTNAPTQSPSLSPTNKPTASPSVIPTAIPSDFPSFVPTGVPTISPTTSDVPSQVPSTGNPTSSSSPSESAGPTGSASSGAPSGSPNVPTVETTSPSESTAADVSWSVGVVERPANPTVSSSSPSESTAADLTWSVGMVERPELTDLAEEEEEEDVVATLAPTKSPTTPGPTPQPVSGTVTSRPTTPALEGAEEDSKSGFRQTFYEGDAWDFLPMNAKAAAMTLGYDATAWDFGKTVFSDSLLWDDLTEEQSMAAIILGYDQNNWDAKHITGEPMVAAGTHSSGEGFSSVWTATEESPANSGEEQGSATPEMETSDESAQDGEKEVTSDEQEATTSFTGQGQAQVPTRRPNYLKYTWDNLPTVQKEAAQQLGYDRLAWDNNETVVTSYLYWNQMTFDLRQAAKALGLRQTSWNTAVAQRESPEDATTSISSAFYSHAGGSATGEAEELAETTEEEAEEAESPVNRPGRFDGKNAGEGGGALVANDIEPEVDAMKHEMGTLKKQLDDALDRIDVQEENLKVHDKILKALQGLDPETTIGSVADIIQLGRKKRGNRRKKGGRNQNQGDRVQPVAPEERNKPAANGGEGGSVIRVKEKQKYAVEEEPVGTTRTFNFWGDGDSDSEEYDEEYDEGEEEEAGTGYATRTHGAWTRTGGGSTEGYVTRGQTRTGTIFGVGVP